MSVAKELVKVQNTKPRAAQLGRRRRIQGLQVDIDDVLLRGKRFRSEITDAILSAEVTRSIEGASSLSISVADDDHELVQHKLLEAKFDLTLDELGFRYRGADDDGEGTLAMKFESTIAARLRAQTGHLKLLRDKATRAEFALMLVRELKHPRVPFFSPPLHVVQPIETPKESRENKVKKDDNREPGLGPGANITIKGVKASAAQIALADTILDVCMSRKCSFRVMALTIATATQESNMEDLNVGDDAHPDSHGPFGQWDGAYSPWNLTVEGATKGFLLGTPNGDHFGMIEFDKKNPDFPFADAIHEVQRNASENTYMYAKWKEEAGNTVREYLGGATAGEGGSVSIEREIPYAFERKKDENSWTCLTRLADEVNWRCFESAGMVYFVSDDYLMRSRIRMKLNSDSPGIDKIAANYVGTKKVQEATITGRARSWAAPPGSVVEIEGRGRADGRYLVKEIRSNLFNSDFEATIVRRSKPLPEPPPESKTITRDTPSRSSGGSEAASAGAQKVVDWAIRQVGVKEGSAKHAEYVRGSGGVYDPWCATFVSYAMVQIAGLPGADRPAYSGTWLEDNWAGGKRVSGDKMEPGDICIYDWGDGGITDHVDIYIGGNECIGGNEGNSEVVRAPFDRSSLVAVIRPDYA